MIKRWLDALWGQSKVVSVPQYDRDGHYIQTERIVALLLKTAAIGIIVLLFYGLSFGTHFEAMMRLVAWASFGALAAGMSGAAGGLLFGLPSVRRIEIVGSAVASDAQNSRNSLADGYAESTNLEQVADWLTKIIVGLTLTSFPYWHRLFNNMARNLTSAMFNAEASCTTRAECGLIPGGTILIAFFLIGFVGAYLLMRRYFIGEMVSGRKDAQDRDENERKDVREAKRDGRLQSGSVNAVDLAMMVQSAESMATKVADSSATTARTGAEGVRSSLDQIEFPDDPWRGKFGGQSKITTDKGEAVITAKVDPLETDPSFFRVAMTVTANPAFAGESAVFYLHPTFGADPNKSAFSAEGVASLEVFAYGAFTVGVLLESGDKLELNLAEIEGVPAAFRMR